MHFLTQRDNLREIISYLSEVLFNSDLPWSIGELKCIVISEPRNDAITQDIQKRAVYFGVYFGVRKMIREPRRQIKFTEKIYSDFRFKKPSEPC